MISSLTVDGSLTVDNGFCCAGEYLSGGGILTPLGGDTVLPCLRRASIRSGGRKSLVRGVFSLSATTPPEGSMCGNMQVVVFRGVVVELSRGVESILGGSE